VREMEKEVLEATEKGRAAAEEAESLTRGILRSQEAVALAEQRLVAGNRVSYASALDCMLSSFRRHAAIGMHTCYACALQSLCITLRLNLMVLVALWIPQCKPR